MRTRGEGGIKKAEKSAYVLNGSPLLLLSKNILIKVLNERLRYNLHLRRKNLSFPFQRRGFHVSIAALSSSAAVSKTVKNA